MNQGSTAWSRLRPALCFSVHPAVREQIAAPQPSAWFLGAFWFAGAHLCRLLSWLLLQWPSFQRFVQANRSAYMVVFALVQFGLMAWGLLLLRKHHASSLWHPRARISTSPFAWQLILLPLVGYHFLYIHKFADAVEQLISIAPRETLITTIQSLHETYSANTAWGTSFAGLVLFSVFTILSPFWEEPLFSGAIANRLVSKWGPVAGAVATAALFALSHVPAYGWSSHIGALMFAGLTYTTLRLLTGKLSLAIAAHLIINVLVMLPKWSIAWLYFRSQS